MDNDRYLTGMPQDYESFGLCKTLLVRREVIDWKHRFTELFVRKTIDLDGILSEIGYDLPMYIEHMTNRLRRIHHFSREYRHDVNEIVKSAADRFFPVIELLSGLDNIIALDFDGTVTANQFRPLYDRCLDCCRTHIVTANPTVTNEWFDRRGYRLPASIHACKGKVSKLKRLIELQKRFDNVFYVDNEEMYLTTAWIFGLKTFHWTNNKIKYFTLKTK